MKNSTKAIIKSGVYCGIGYAGLAAGFDYFDGQNFRIWRFVFNTLVFGLFMGYMVYYNLKKHANKTE